MLVALAAGCGGSGGGAGTSSRHHTRTRASAAGPAKCKLSAKQRKLIVRLKQEIVRMHQLEQPLKTVHPHGPLKLELLLNRFMLSVGNLPVDDRALLIRKAKSAVALCQDCFNALESIEPALQTKFGESPCKAGF
ncbi:MAG TPA: hypothetical protein VJ814_12050 [Gaiellaceae bacterium]|nr:hypothetical protein [Gaiellaceae bacterium]